MPDSQKDEAAADDGSWSGQLKGLTLGVTLAQQWWKKIQLKDTSTEQEADVQEPRTIIDDNRFSLENLEHRTDAELMAYIESKRKSGYMHPKPSWTKDDFRIRQADRTKPILHPQASHRNKSSFVRSDLSGRVSELFVDLHLIQAQAAWLASDFITMDKEAQKALDLSLPVACYEYTAKICLYVAVAAYGLGDFEKGDMYLLVAEQSRGRFKEGEMLDWVNNEALILKKRSNTYKKQTKSAETNSSRKRESLLAGPGILNIPEQIRAATASPEPERSQRTAAARVSFELPASNTRQSAESLSRGAALPPKTSSIPAIHVTDAKGRPRDTTNQPRVVVISQDASTQGSGITTASKKNPKTDEIRKPHPAPIDIKASQTSSISRSLGSALAKERQRPSPSASPMSAIPGKSFHPDSKTKHATSSIPTLKHRMSLRREDSADGGLPTQRRFLNGLPKASTPIGNSDDLNKELGSVDGEEDDDEVDELEDMEEIEIPKARAGELVGKTIW